MIHRRLLYLLSLLLLAALLAACPAPAAEPAAEAPAAEEAAAPAAEEATEPAAEEDSQAAAADVVTIEYWQYNFPARIEAMDGRQEMALAALKRAVEATGRVRRAGRARWAFEFGPLRDDPAFARAIDGLERNSALHGG